MSNQATTHKAIYTFICQAKCACGWKGADWVGKGAKANASKEYKWHLSNCESA